MPAPETKLILLALAIAMASGVALYNRINDGGSFPAHVPLLMEGQAPASQILDGVATQEPTGQLR